MICTFFFKPPACMLKTILWLTQFVCTVVNNFSYDLISAVSKLMFIKFYSVTCSYSNTKHNFTVAAAGLINKFNREMTSAVFSCLHCWVIKPESKKGNIFQPTWGVVLSLKQSSTTPFSLFSDCTVLHHSCAHSFPTVKDPHSQIQQRVIFN